MKARLGKPPDPAVSEAAAALEGRGFRSTGNRRWTGTLTFESASYDVTVKLPSHFPHALPEVFLAPLPDERLAHVEQTGKVCIAPETGVLLDTTSPRRLIEEALERASRVLAASPEQHEADRVAEFGAHWQFGDAPQYYSICSLPPKPGPLVIYELRSFRGLIAETDQKAKRWLERASLPVRMKSPAYELPIRNLLAPPAFTEALKMGEILELIETHAEPTEFEAFSAWLQKRGLPSTVVFSQNLPPKDEHVFFALELPRIPAAAKKGHRVGKVPPERQLAFALAEPARRVAVRRMDPEFLLNRAGGQPSFLQETVAVIGCGAVGSHIVEALAAMGVGNLHLVDPDGLNPENVQRHALGARYIGAPKVDALQIEVGRRFPHVEVTIDRRGILEILDDRTARQRVLRANIVVVAIGDETVELRTNDILRRTAPRIHVWLEAFGLAGHVLTIRPEDAFGCYGCLFERDASYGIVNRSALAAPGQTLQKTIAGCPGVFTPFGVVDAVRAATEAAREVGRTLLRKQSATSLSSWVGDTAGFQDMGYRLSDRGRRFRPNETRIDAIGVRGCSACSEWTAR